MRAVELQRVRKETEGERSAKRRLQTEEEPEPACGPLEDSRFIDFTRNILLCLFELVLLPTISFL